MPSLIALRKLGGVIRCKPSAAASGAKMLSLAPTGVPAYCALIAAISRWYSPSPVCLEGLPPGVEVRAVGGVGCLQFGGDLVGDLFDVAR